MSFPSKNWRKEILGIKFRSSFAKYIEPYFKESWCSRRENFFPGDSDSKESACNVGHLGSIPGLGRSPGGGLGNPLQYSWSSLVAQLVKNPPAMWDTWVQSLGWEDPLEKGMATHSSILAWRSPWTIESMGLQRVRHYWATFTSHHYKIFNQVSKPYIDKYT